MKVDTIRNVKTALNRVVRDLPTTGSVIITRDGRPCAVLMPVTEDTDLEVIALARSHAFWRQIDRAQRRAQEEGWTPLDAPPPHPPRPARSRRKRASSSSG